MSVSENELQDPEILPHPFVRAGFWVWALATAFVVLALTPYTFSLDDIKIPGLYVGGALCLVTWAALWYFNQVENPPRLFWGTYLGYIIICVISALATQPVIKWIAWQYIGEYVSVFGFTLLGSSVLRTRKMVEIALKYWVALALITTGFGLIHYSGFLGTIYTWLYPSPPRGEDVFHDLLNTFKASRSMLSTILNVQFFGNFLLMLLPVCAACALFAYHNLKRCIAYGEGRLNPMIWTVLSGIAVGLSLTCIFATFSKSSAFPLPFLILIFIIAVFVFTDLWNAPWKRLALSLSVAALIMAAMGATVYYYTAGDFRDQMKNLEENIAPRRIMFGAALNIFHEYPVLGGGPGSYRILFPEFRSPNYHLSRISNVTTFSHNWLLDILSETGALGALSYLVYLSSICWFGWKAIRRSPDMILRLCVIGCGVGLLGILIGSMTTPMTRWPVGMVSVHAMMGTTMGVILLALSPAPRRSARGAPESLPALAPPSVLARQVRGVVFVAAGCYLVYIASWSNRIFEAAVYHNEGLKRTDLPASYFGKSGIAEEPEVIAILNKGVDYFDKSLALDPGRPTTYYKLAHAYNRLGDQAKSLDAYLRLQKYFPDYSEIHYNLGIIYYNMALDASQDVEKKSASAMADSRAEMLKDYDLSITQFDRQAKLSNKVSVWYFRANARLLKAQKLEQDSAEAKAVYHEAGEYFLKTSTLPVASVIQEEGQQEHELDLKYSALKQAREAFRRSGDDHAAAAAAEAYLKQFPSSITSLREAVALYAKVGAFSDSSRLLDEELGKNPLNGELLTLKAATLFDAGQQAEAAKQAHYALALDSSLTKHGTPLLNPSQRKDMEEIMAGGKGS